MTPPTDFQITNVVVVDDVPTVIGNIERHNFVIKNTHIHYGQGDGLTLDKCSHPRTKHQQVSLWQGYQLQLEKRFQA